MRNLLVLILTLLTINSWSFAHNHDLAYLDKSARYEIVNTYKYPGYQVIQFNLAPLSHYSYMLISGNDCVVVDPGRDTFVYQKMAQSKKIKIKAVLLTHSHADFVAGHIELATKLAIPIYISAAAKAGYKHVAVNDGDKLALGSATLKFITTPGHTPDGTCIYVYSKATNKSPEIIFTGDTLFVGSVGRPDLLEGKASAASLASQLYDSWHRKLALAGNDAIIFPAHGAGSLCGANLGSSPYSTIGKEKQTNSVLQYKDRSAFIANILNALPGAPQYFGYNAAMNRVGPKVVDWHAQLEMLDPDKKYTDFREYFVADIRPNLEYVKGHIPNSLNIALRGKFENWIGTMVPWKANLILAGDGKDLKEAIYRLHRVGYKAKCLSFRAWKKAGLPLSTNKTISPAQLRDLTKKGQAPLVVDVRKKKEWQSGHIGNVANLPLDVLGKKAGKLERKKPVITVCRSGYRASIAMGILERHGFTKVGTIAGGGKAWVEAGFPLKVEGSVTYAPKASCSVGIPSKPVKYVHLPQRIAASELKRLMMDLPGSYEIVDIRPAHYFNDYHLNGAKNVSIAELLENSQYLQGQKPLIIVDRDGSLAMAIGGILSQKTKRVIKVLYGGLQAYWHDTQLKPFITPGLAPQNQQQQPSPKKQKQQQDQKEDQSAGC